MIRKISCIAVFLLLWGQLGILREFILSLEITLKLLIKSFIISSYRKRHLWCKYLETIDCQLKYTELLKADTVKFMCRQSMVMLYSNQKCPDLKWHINCVSSQQYNVFFHIKRMMSDWNILSINNKWQRNNLFNKNEKLPKHEF